MIFEVRDDQDGSYFRLVTLWKATRQEQKLYEETRKRPKPPSAESIARLADQGKDVAGFFTNRGKMVHPIQRVNVDLTAQMLDELDRLALDLNVSRQAVIKTFIRQALDQQYLASRARSGTRGIGPSSGFDPL